MEDKKEGRISEERRREDRRLRRRGLFVVVDGLDGIGKGVVERAITEYEQKLEKAVLDTVAFSREYRKGIPELKDFWNPPEVCYHTLSTAEPTYAGIGFMIRSEIISNNGRHYSTIDQIQAYSLDRKIQMERVVIPALEIGLNVIQARCFAATLCYQSLFAENEGRSNEDIRKLIMQQEGNKLQLKFAPDLLIIPTIKNTDELMERLRNRALRSKYDNAIFENAEFQGKLKPLFESDWLREIFTREGSCVAYLNAGISEQETRNQTIEIYSSYLSSRKVPDKYLSPQTI